MKNKKVEFSEKCFWKNGTKQAGINTKIRENYTAIPYNLSVLLFWSLKF